jgi:hypothetical protein
MRSVLGFFLAWFIGVLSSLLLLSSYEVERPHCDLDRDHYRAHQKEITKAVNKISIRAGLVVAVAWLVYHYSN